MTRNLSVTVLLLAAGLPVLAVAAPNERGADSRRDAGGVRKTSFMPSDAFNRGAPAESGAAAVENETLVFSAPPRESPEEGERLYRPVADYLSRATGRKIEYRHPGNWLSYQTAMQKGAYDVVFDGAHFNSWRVTNLNHNTLARLADERSFAVVVRRDNSQITNVKQLAGKKVCAMNPPNLGTLTLLGEFDNPLRQPLIVNTTGWDKIYSAVALENKCTAAVIPVTNLQELDGAGAATRVIHRSRALPNQAFSAGPRLTREDQARLSAALISASGAEATRALRTANGSHKPLVAAAKEEYAGLDAYLKDSWGYTR